MALFHSKTNLNLVMSLNYFWRKKSKEADGL